MSVNVLQSSSFPADLPHRFQITKQQRISKAREMLQPGKSAYELRKILWDDSYFCSLKHNNLYWPKEYSDKKLAYVEEVLELWVNAIAKRFDRPYFWFLEVGVEGQLHSHVVGRRLEGYPIGKGNKVVQKICNTDADWLRVISYGYKTPVPLTEDPDRIKAAKLPDWQERLDDYYQALARIQKLMNRGKPRKQVYHLSDYVF